ncbi:MAG: phosphotransacetylase family protein [bacterium]
MKKIFFTTTKEYSGVSAVVIGCILLLKEKGLRVGYMKPLGYLPIHKDGIWTDIDSSFVFSILNEKENAGLSSPFVLNEEVIEDFLDGKMSFKEGKLEEAYNFLSKDKDVFIFEGGFNIYQGRSFGMSGFEVANKFDLPVVLIERFKKMEVSDRVLLMKEILKERLKGVILNMVFDEDMESAKKEATNLSKNGISVFGIIPWTNVLQSSSIKALKDELGAEVLCAQEYIDKLVQSVMIGAMDAEHALTFFQRKKNLAVITGGDRADIQLAALEAHCVCLILTGGFPPSDIILGLANQKNVPILLVGYDTLTTAQKAEWLIGHSRTHEKEKLSLLTSLIKENVKIDELLA